MSYSKILLEIAVLMLYILIGYILRKIRILTEEGLRDISRLVVNLALPVMILNSLNVEFNPEYLRNILFIALFAAIFISFTSISGHYAAKRLPGDDSQKKVMNYCMLVGNGAFIGFPICAALFGQIGPFYASIYILIQNIFQWTHGVNIFKQEKFSAANMKNLINPGTTAITIGLIMFLLNMHPPVLIDRVIKGIAGIATPLALIVIGATLYGYNLIDIASERRIQIVAVLKTLIFPAVMFLLLFFIPLDPLIKSILIIQSSTPTQATAAAFSKNFGGDSVIAAKIVFLATVLSLVTIPLFLILINL